MYSRGVRLQSGSRWLLVLAVTWLLSAAYAWHYLDRGWWPNNAGAFSLSALRVHDGELPHRDFDEIYTGGASYLHALSYDVFGTKMTSPRRVLFLVFLTWIPSFYWIATRFAPPPVAGLFTLLAASWSLPIYSEPIASWYNLFLATHGLAALLCYFDSRRRRWLFVVGVCGGLSVLAKIVGLYFLAAAGLALLFHETQEMPAAASSDAPQEPAAQSRVFGLLATGGVAVCAAIVAIGIARVAGVTGFLHLALPIAVLAVVAIVAELRAAPGALLERASALWRLGWPVAAGAAVAVAPFVLPFVLSGSIGVLVRGLFIDPQLRLSVTSNPPPPVSWTAIPVLLVLASPWRWPNVNALILGALLAVPAALLVANGSGGAYPSVVGAIRILLPCAVVAGSIALVRASQSTAAERSSRFAVLAVAALWALVQFPVAETIYIYFAAPLGLLAVLAIADLNETMPRTLVVGAAATLLAFSVLWIDRSLHLGLPRPPFVADDQQLPLEIERAGGIRVRQNDKMQYEELVKVVRRVARGEYIYATPDCPEVYFLTGFKNPTRTTYDFFDDPNGRVDQIERALEAHSVNTVIINLRPQYSAPASPALVSWLRQQYPTGGRVGDFFVLWRDTAQGWSPSQH